MHWAKACLLAACVQLHHLQKLEQPGRQQSMHCWLRRRQQLPTIHLGDVHCVGCFKATCSQLWCLWLHMKQQGRCTRRLFPAPPVVRDDGM
jgi:hypothetical protein